MAKLIDIIGKGLSSEPESEIKTAIDELEKLLAQIVFDYTEELWQKLVNEADSQIEI